MKLVDVLIIYKKVIPAGISNVRLFFFFFFFFFVIRNNSGVQIFRNDEKARQKHLPKMYTLVVTMNWNRFRNIFRIRFRILCNRSELSHCFMYAQGQHTRNRWSHKGVTVYIYWCMTKVNILTVLFLSFEVVWDLTFFDLWPLIRRLDEEVTVDLFGCLTKINTLTVLLISFHVVCILTFFDLWPLNHRSGEEVTVDTFWCLTPINTLAVLVLSFEIV